MKQRKLVVAIDGPAGAGKSTVARAVADALGYLYIDSGAMYRAATLGCQRRGIDLADPDAVSKAVRSMKIRLASTDAGPPAVYLDDEDVTEAIRAARVGEEVSIVSSHASVRDEMVSRLRHTAREGGVVMDGRDIGTVVFPDADVKVFLTATPEERARRRLQEMRARGESLTFEQVLQSIVERDQRDSSRASAPLKRASDAILVDTTPYDIAEVIERVLAICRERGAL